jgi:hypothetical protein
MKAELGNMGRKGLGALVGLVLVVLIAAAAADARTALFKKPTRQQTAPRAACGHSKLYSSGSPPPRGAQPRTHGRFSGTVRLSVSPTERPSDTVIATAFGPKSLGRSGIAGVLIRR